MGKRKKRLLSAKYAKKFAHLRKTIAEAVADGVVTEEETEQIEIAVEAVEKTVEPEAPVEKKFNTKTKAAGIVRKAFSSSKKKK